MLKVRTISGVKTARITKRYLPAFISFCAGFVCAGAKILGVPCSLCVCACAGAGRFAPVAFAGSLLYYLVSGTLSAGVPKLCAVLIVGALFPLLRRHRFFEPALLSAAACFVMLLINCAYTVGLGGGGYAVAFAMTDSVICACLVFMFASIADEFSVTHSLRISGASGVFLSVLFVMCICTLSSVPLPLNPGRIAGTVVLLHFARKYRALGGALIGVLTACGVVLSDPFLAGNTLIMASSGLICGAVAGLGNAAMYASFMISSLVSLTAVGINSDTFVMFWDLALGVMVNIALPEELLSVSRSLLTTSKSTADLVGQTASARLDFASRTIHDIRKEIDLISVKIESRRRPKSISKRVESSLCSRCEMFELCFKKSASKTAVSMGVLEKLHKSYGTLNSEDVKTYLPACTKPAALMTAFDNCSDELDFERACNKSVASMRKFLSEQLITMEQLLCDMSARVGRIKEVDEHLSARVKELFEVSGCRGARVCVYKNEVGRRYAEAFVNGSFKSDILRLTLRLSNIMECDMELPSINVLGKVTRLIFTEKPELEASIAYFQASCKGGQYCGDTLETLTVTESERYVLLSDGMGTGERARLDSMFTVSLLKRLVTSGVSMGCSERLVNSALCVKGWDESFSTVDMLRLDLFSRSACFLKAGAAASYIYREGSIIRIGSSSLPAGILDRCEPEMTTQRINAGDMIILATDGVDESIITENSALLERASLSGADKASRMIGEQAVKSFGGEITDDITLAVIMIGKA